MRWRRLIVACVVVDLERLIQTIGRERERERLDYSATEYLLLQIERRDYSRDSDPRSVKTFGGSISYGDGDVF